MAGSYNITHKGKTIFCLDVEGLQVKDKTLFRTSIEEAKEKIRKAPPKSLLVITHVKNTGFDTEIANIMKEYASHNTPYVKASAVVGVSGMQKIILTAIKTLTGRDFHVTETIEEAKEWLVKQ
jgi:hypothetical protein